MTPKLKLSEAARKPLLSWIRKSFIPGILQTTRSTHITDAPATQAVGQGWYVSRGTWAVIVCMSRGYSARVAALWQG